MPPINPARLPAMYQDAVRHLSARRFSSAKERFETILSIKPDLAEAHFQLARACIALGEVEKGLAHFDMAADLKPQEPEIWKAYAKALYDVADPGKRTAFLAKAKKARIDPQVLLSLQNYLMPKAGKSKISIGSANPADVQKAISHLTSGRTQQAVTLAEQLLRRHPNVVILLDILANGQAALGQAEKAEKTFRKAIALEPDYAELRANFGQFLVRQGRHDEAIDELRVAIELGPDMPAALKNMGFALNARLRFSKAIPFLERALLMDPKSDLTRSELAHALLADEKPHKVAEILRPIMSNPDPDGINHILVARALAELMRNDEAEAAYDKAIEVAPESTQPLSAKAAYLQLLGRFEEAEVLFRKVAEMEPYNGQNLQTFLVSHKVQPGDPLIEKMVDLFDDEKVPESQRKYFGFALAKAFEDTKQYDRAFKYLKAANDAMSREFPLDPGPRQEQTRNIIKGFGAVDFDAYEPQGATGFAPIFITGLPRSGTTLVEQIIASHSTVAGGGELGFASDAIIDAVGGFLDRDNGKFDLGAKELAAVGHKIEALMREAVPEGERVTDKGVLSYFVIGPLRVAMPNAKIVVVRRDPRDVILSMYKNLFAPGKHLYAYDLRTLVEYYKCFESLISFWREKTPDNFYEIWYEDLIADPEAETRKLLAACDLEWEDQCLSFHENKRRVDTLSVHQVRQPIYKSSQAAWRRYESELGELFEALGPDYAPEAAD